MKTKAELEEKISYLEQRVAALEGAVTAYRFALEQANRPASQPLDIWPSGQYTWPPHKFVTYNTSE